jgi:hypothetical protein
MAERMEPISPTQEAMPLYRQLRALGIEIRASWPAEPSSAGVSLSSVPPGQRAQIARHRFGLACLAFEHGWTDSKGQRVPGMLRLWADLLPEPYTAEMAAKQVAYERAYDHGIDALTGATA